MPAWLWNERVEFCLAVIIGIIIGSSPVIVMPILQNLLPGVVLWPVFLACICVALIVWWFICEISIASLSVPPHGVGIGVCCSGIPGVGPCLRRIDVVSPRSGKPIAVGGNVSGNRHSTRLQQLLQDIRFPARKDEHGVCGNLTKSAHARAVKVSPRLHKPRGPRSSPPSHRDLVFFVRKAVKQIGHTGGGNGRYGPGSHVPARDLGLFLRSGPISPEPVIQGLLPKHDVAPRGSP
jgi:hypothetical protein